MPRISPIFQSDSSECALTCLAMILHAHRHYVSPSDLRIRFPTNARGTTLLELSERAREFGLEAHALHVPISELQNVRLPAILHWDNNHYVILECLHRSGVSIVDPARGRRRIDYDQLGKHFHDVVLEVAPGSSFQELPRERRGLPRWIESAVRDLLSDAKVLLPIVALLEAISLLIPSALQRTIDSVNLDLSSTNLLMLVLAGLLLTQAVLSLLRGRAVAKINARLGEKLQVDLYSRLMQTPLDYIERKGLGELMGRFGSADAIRHTISAVSIEAAIDGVFCVFVFVLLLDISGALALVSVGTIATIACIHAWSFERLRTVMQGEVLATSRKCGFLVENLRGALTIRINNYGEVRLNSQRKAIAEERAAALERQVRSITTTHLILSVVAIDLIVCTMLGIQRVAAFRMTLGAFIAFTGYRTLLIQRASVLFDKLSQVKMLHLHVERVNDVFCAPSFHPQLRSSVSSPQRSGLLIENVSHRYPGGRAYVLESVNANLPMGGTLALVGASGRGKSTLLKIIAGAIEPTCGSIKFSGGRANCDYRVAGVMQEDTMFAGTVRENLTGFAAITDCARLERYARIAQVHEFVMSLPSGYDTSIGDMGAALSGGERQRLLIARALYCEPDLLLLDEATNHVDLQTEGAILAGIRKLGICTVLVAHRPEAIAWADLKLLLR